MSCFKYIIFALASVVVFQVVLSETHHLLVASTRHVHYHGDRARSAYMGQDVSTLKGVCVIAPFVSVNVAAIVIATISATVARPRRNVIYGRRGRAIATAVDGAVAAAAAAA